MAFWVAVLVVTFPLIVRSVLVTALNLDVGPRMWWPSALASRPDVDVDEIDESSVEVRT